MCITEIPLIPLLHLSAFFCLFMGRRSMKIPARTCTDMPTYARKQHVHMLRRTRTHPYPHTVSHTCRHVPARKLTQIHPPPRPRQTYRLTLPRSTSPSFPSAPLAAQRRHSMTLVEFHDILECMSGCPLKQPNLLLSTSSGTAEQQ
jgi:hypothetical protein